MSKASGPVDGRELMLAIERRDTRDVAKRASVECFLLGGWEKAGIVRKALLIVLRVVCTLKRATMYLRLLHNSGFPLQSILRL